MGECTSRLLSLRAILYRSDRHRQHHAAVAADDDRILAALDDSSLAADHHAVSLREDDPLHHAILSADHLGCVHLASCRSEYSHVVHADHTSHCAGILLLDANREWSGTADDRKGCVWDDPHRQRRTQAYETGVATRDSGGGHANDISHSVVTNKIDDEVKQRFTISSTNLSLGVFACVDRPTMTDRWNDGVTMTSCFLAGNAPP